jgi:hypothetical protein
MRLTRVLRSRRRQPFEVALEIDVIELGEIAALKRIDASLDLRAEVSELKLMLRVDICVREYEWFAQHGSAPAARHLRR